jgi:group I intron endonuclease
MIINANIEDLKLQGVYQIKNLVNNKLYIGSTKVSFLKRMCHHAGRLNNSKHKNPHLQHAWNKYGESNFEFSILEICDKDECLLKEQNYLDLIINQDNYYNINPNATGGMSKESVIKRIQTIKKKYENGYVSLNKGQIAWNKGLKLDNTDHLKVPKTITDKVLISRQLRTINNRENQPDIYVYTLDLIFLGKWRSAIDLQEWSLTSNNNLPMKSRFKTGKHKGLNPNILKASNIQTACKFKTPYKSLIFSNMPLHQEIDVEKSDNIGEG